MPRKAGSLHNWCFTLNNYTEDEYNTILAACESHGKYFIIGKEIADTGTPHLQGFVSFRRRRDFKHVLDIFGARCHLEAARGTPKQNRIYCSKTGEFTEGGTIPQEGRPKSRDEIASAFASSLDGGNGGLAKFAYLHPGAWYYSGTTLLRNAQLLIQPEHRPSISVKWIYGKPGAGKSRYAHEQLPESYLKEPRTKWWNGYMHQKTCIIDDFGPNGIDINHLLRWFDRYKCLVETKGGMIALLADTFIVTSNFHPDEIFVSPIEGTHPQLPALLRRIELIKM